MRALIALVVAGLLATVGRGGETPLARPQFRGPGGSGIAKGQKPPVEFGPDKNVKWIADDTIYIRTAGHLFAFAEKK
jgi:outer membrane protein assembly factor BamB